MRSRRGISCRSHAHKLTRPCRGLRQARVAACSGRDRAGKRAAGTRSAGWRCLPAGALGHLQPVHSCLGRAGRNPFRTGARPQRSADHAAPGRGSGAGSCRMRHAVVARGGCGRSEGTGRRTGSGNPADLGALAARLSAVRPVCQPPRRTTITLSWWSRTSFRAMPPSPPRETIRAGGAWSPHSPARRWRVLVAGGGTPGAGGADAGHACRLLSVVADGRGRRALPPGRADRLKCRADAPGLAVPPLTGAVRFVCSIPNICGNFEPDVVFVPDRQVACLSPPIPPIRLRR